MAAVDLQVKLNKCLIGYSLYLVLFILPKNTFDVILNYNHPFRTIRTFKQWIIHIVRRLLRKEYCKVCGQELTEIRGKYPKEPRRKVCPCCVAEKLEWIEEQNNIEVKCSNNT